MKICIELDEEINNEWEAAKEELEGVFERFYKQPASLTDFEVLKGLLFCFETAIGESADQIFIHRLSDKEVERICDRATRKH
jgi:hypothetical protein